MKNFDASRSASWHLSRIHRHVHLLFIRAIAHQSHTLIIPLCETKAIHVSRDQCGLNMNILAYSTPAIGKSLKLIYSFQCSDQINERTRNIHLKNGMIKLELPRF